MKKVLVTIMLVLIALLAAGYIILTESGKDLSAYKHLVRPRVTEFPEASMLVVTAGGDPSKNAGRALTRRKGSQQLNDFHPKLNGDRDLATRSISGCVKRSRIVCPDRE